MVTLTDIRGQQRAVAQLRRALASNRVAHAYLFCGPAHCGKHTTGLALAAALNCESPDAERALVGCGSCLACDKIAAGNHPDVQTLQQEGAAQIIPIQTIRKRVIPQLGMAPHEGKARVFLIEEAAALQGPAANALLKTLEEPPARTHFVLCTVAPDQLLTTIRSRCQRVSFNALPPDVAAELGDDDDSVQVLRDLAQQLFRAADDRNPRSVYDAAAAAAGKKKQVTDILALLAGNYHEAARQAALQQQLTRAAAFSRSAAMVLDTQLVMREHNAHPTLSIEALLFELRALAPTRRQASAA